MAGRARIRIPLVVDVDHELWARLSGLRPDQVDQDVREFVLEALAGTPWLQAVEGRVELEDSGARGPLPARGEA